MKIKKDARVNADFSKRVAIPTVSVVTSESSFSWKIGEEETEARFIFGDGIIDMLIEAEAEAEGKIDLTFPGVEYYDDGV